MQAVTAVDVKMYLAFVLYNGLEMAVAFPVSMLMVAPATGASSSVQYGMGWVMERWAGVGWVRYVLR